jgi:hypothetical protein
MELGRASSFLCIFAPEIPYTEYLEWPVFYDNRLGKD